MTIGRQAGDLCYVICRQFSAYRPANHNDADKVAFIPSRNTETMSSNFLVVPVYTLG